jgi:hypothetical protein
MSNYKSIRSKKNADLLNAMSNVRKDLYDMKQMETVLKLNSSNNLTKRNIGSPLSIKNINSSFESTSNLFRKSTSLKDLQKFETQNNSSNLLNSKLRPLRSVKSNKSNDFYDIDLFDLDVDDNERKNRKDSCNSQKLQPLNTERIYLNTSKNDLNLVRKKSFKELEEEIVIF